MRMDPSLDRTEEEKSEMKRIYTPGSNIDIIQSRAMVSTPTSEAASGGEGVAGQGGIQSEFIRQQQQQLQQFSGARVNSNSRLYGPGMRPHIIMNPIDELNLLLRFYFPCPTCEPGNPYNYLCEHPIPDPRVAMVMGSGLTGRPIPRTVANMPQDHCACFNCRRPNLMPKRDRRRYPQDVCAVCSERFCQNVLGYCGPIKRESREGYWPRRVTTLSLALSDFSLVLLLPRGNTESKARVFNKLGDFSMPPRQGLLTSTFNNLFGTGSDPDSIGTFMPHLFGDDGERVRAFDHWLKTTKGMTLNDFYHAVIRYAVSNSPGGIVLGSEEPGLERAPWQGVPGRFMKYRITPSDWVCIVCAKDLAENYARDWYNEELRRNPPPPGPAPGNARSANRPNPTPPPQQTAAASSSSASSSGGFFSSIKKGINDLGDKFNEITADPPTLPPQRPTPLLPLPPVTNFTDRQVMRGNQLAKFPPYLATSRDIDGHPVFLAIYHNTSTGAMIPAKICTNLRNPVRVALDGKEYQLTEKDRYESFLENSEIHKWIRVSNSNFPANESGSQTVCMALVEFLW